MHNRKKKKGGRESTYRDFRPRKRGQVELDTWFLGVELACNAMDMHCRLPSMSFTSLVTMDAFSNVRTSIETSHMGIS